MLKSLISAKNGDVYLNSLRRYVKSVLIVPSQENTVVPVPAMVGTSRGQSALIALQGPEDAKSELYSLVGVQGVTNLGMGVITSNGTTAITGTGTAFLSQLQVGGTLIIPTVGSFTVAAIASNTACTVNVIAAALANTQYFYSTPLVTAVRDRLCVTIQDAAWRRDMMNVPINVAHVFGDANKPMYIKEASLLETDQTLLFQFFNYSATGPASITFQSEARKWQIESLKRKVVNDFVNGLRQRKMFVHPYWLGLDDTYLTLAAGDSATAFLTVTGDITLILFNLYATAITGGQTGDTQEVFSMEIFDPVTGRGLQVQPITWKTACGDARNPFPLPSPLICEPASQIKIKFRNLVTDASTVIFLTFHGVALYTGMAGRGSALTDPAIMAEAQRLYKSGTPNFIAASPRG